MRRAGENNNQFCSSSVPVSNQFGSRTLEKKEILQRWEELGEKRRALGSTTVEVSAIINKLHSIKSVFDTGNGAYSLIDDGVVTALGLTRTEIPDGLNIKGFTNEGGEKITEIATFRVDFGGHVEEHHMAYIVKGLSDDLLIGHTWLKNHRAVIDCEKDEVVFKDTCITVRGLQSAPKMMVTRISGSSLELLLNQNHSSSVPVLVMKVSLEAIDNAIAKLNKKKNQKEDLSTLPAWIQHDNRDVFSLKSLYAERLPPNRPGLDHEIHLTVPDEQAPHGVVYPMSKDGLVLLRKVLYDLLDKGFIRQSNSPAGAPVLLVKKEGDKNVRFCIDYRGLNAVTKKDRYPLPQIQETLRRIGKAKRFTKLDIVAAFHNVRVQKGREHLTAFKTRIGSFEWLVTPFGMANSPSTFQRYINHALGDLLDDYATAYVDDILVWTESDSEALHHKQVNEVLKRLKKAGLTVDINKSEFDTRRTKFLGFIIEPGSCSMDPEKVKAITEWEAPKTVKEVRSFLGFANFYRTFIKNFSKLAAPLTDLTVNAKKKLFIWNATAQKSFEELKTIFVSEPVLSAFDPNLDTIVETDSSGYATGAILLQNHSSKGRNTGSILEQNQNKTGTAKTRTEPVPNWKPVGYLSKKMNAAQANYPIHDKEMLAIMNAVEAWDPELKGTPFKVLTDHRNLTYFATKKLLSERQIRWWDRMNERYQYTIEFRPGDESPMPDALSR